MTTTRRELLRGFGALAGCAMFRTGASAGVPRWSTVPNGQSITLNGVQYEVASGLKAVEATPDGIVKFTLTPGNGWPDDDPDSTERAELDGWAGAKPSDDQLWSAWSIFVSEDQTTSADWCILQQLYQQHVGPSVAHVLKPNGHLHWVGGHRGDDWPSQHAEPLLKGRWNHFVETYKTSPKNGVWRSWLNGKQVLDYTGPLGAPGKSVSYAKFGIYRTVYQSWDGAGAKPLRVGDNFTALYANLRFGPEPLDALIANPPAVPDLPA